MDYLKILLVAAFAAVIQIEATIPSYIKRCKQNDPELAKCIENSIDGLREKLTSGIPELGVPPTDPMVFDSVDLVLGPGINTTITNLSLYGLRYLLIKNVVVDLSKDTFNFDISVSEFTGLGTYDIDAALGGIPLKGKGPIYFKPKSVTGRGMLQGKKVVRGGKRYYYFKEMKLKLYIKDYEIRLDNLFGGDPIIGNATNKLLNEEKAEVLPSIIPGVEKAVVEKALLIGNNICKHFTWDELLPES